jgi:TonB family protein
MILTLTAVVALQAAAAAARPPASTADLPQWSRAPSAADMNQAYPAGAKAKNLAGSGVVECTVGADGQLADCVAVEETPAGEGFGEAALSLAARFILPTKAPSGASTIGRTVRFPVRWLNKADGQEPLIVVYDDIGRTGRVTFNCRVVEERSVDNCVVIDAQPRGTSLFAPAAQAAARYKVAANRKPGQRVLLIVEMKSQ